MITYRDLKNHLAHFSEEQLEQNVTVVDLNSDEVRPVVDHVLGWKSKDIEAYGDHDWAIGLDRVDGVLDEGHPYLTIAG